MVTMDYQFALAMRDFISKGGVTMFCNNCGKEIADNADVCDFCGKRISGAASGTVKRKKCCICGSPKMGEAAPVLFVGEKGDLKEICSECELKMDILQRSVSDKDIREATNYFLYKMQYTTDREVKNHLDSILDRRAVMPESGGAYVSNGNIWRSGIRLAAWLMFAGIIIAGIALAAGIGSALGKGFGFLIFLISIPVAFFSIAGIMIYLDMASDIAAMREIMEKKK